MLAYLARYTHRVAIANSRIVSLDDGRVGFTWKNYRCAGQTKVMTLEGNKPAPLTSSENPVVGSISRSILRASSSEPSMSWRTMSGSIRNRSRNSPRALSASVAAITRALGSLRNAYQSGLPSTKRKSSLVSRDWRPAYRYVGPIRNLTPKIHYREGSRERFGCKTNALDWP